jgi:histidyl-tRNA synthetase
VFLSSGPPLTRGPFNKLANIPPCPILAASLFLRLGWDLTQPIFKPFGLPGAPGLDSETWVQKLDAYIAPLGAERNAAALAHARELRRAGLSVEVGDGTFRLKKSFEAADRVARHIVILGEDEARSGILTVKTFATGEQTKIAQADLAQALRA